MFICFSQQLHFVIALSKYYSQLRREKSYGSVNGGAMKDHSLQRIYLLPTPTSSTFPPINYNHQSHHTSDRKNTNDCYYHDEPSNDVLVYAPIPLSRLSMEAAQDIQATEAWISPVPLPNRGHGHRHHKHHSHAHSGSRQHRHKASTSSLPPYRDEAEDPLVGEKAV